jgi:hypothetical protein
VIVLGIAVLGVGAVIVDAWRASDWRSDITKDIRDGKYAGSNPQDLLTIIREPRGTRGLTRGLIALLIIVLAALALVVTVISGASDAGDLRKTIITSLLTVLATVAGFYFGARTAQTSGAGADATSARASTHQAGPTITALKPNKQVSGNPVDIIGTGLADTKAVLFDGDSAVISSIEGDTKVTVMPPAKPAGTATAVIVVTATSRSTTGPQAEFTYE